MKTKELTFAELSEINGGRFTRTYSSSGSTVIIDNGVNTKYTEVQNDPINVGSWNCYKIS